MTRGPRVATLPILCALGRHKPEPLARWNNGYYFSYCRRCGRDLIRTAFENWHIPYGTKVVWQAEPRKSGLTIDAGGILIRPAEARQPEVAEHPDRVAANEPEPRPVEFPLRDEALDGITDDFDPTAAPELVASADDNVSPTAPVTALREEDQDEEAARSTALVEPAQVAEANDDRVAAHVGGEAFDWSEPVPAPAPRREAGVFDWTVPDRVAGDDDSDGTDDVATATLMMTEAELPTRETDEVADRPSPLPIDALLRSLGSPIDDRDRTSPLPEPSRRDEPVDPVPPLGVARRAAPAYPDFMDESDDEPFDFGPDAPPVRASGAVRPAQATVLSPGWKDHLRRTSEDLGASGRRFARMFSPQPPANTPPPNIPRPSTPRLRRPRSASTQPAPSAGAGGDAVAHSVSADENFRRKPKADRPVSPDNLFIRQVAVTSVVLVGGLVLVASVVDGRRNASDAPGAAPLPARPTLGSSTGSSSGAVEASDMPARIGARADAARNDPAPGANAGLGRGIKAYVTASLLNCRAIPDNRALTVRKLERGAGVEVLSADGYWVSIAHQGRQCWASAKFISQTKPA